MGEPREAVIHRSKGLVWMVEGEEGWKKTSLGAALDRKFDAV